MNDRFIYRKNNLSLRAAKVMQDALYDKKNKHKPEKLEYLGIIFAGGQAKRFGDVKALSFVYGEPLIKYLIDVIHVPRSKIATVIDVGPSRFFPNMGEYAQMRQRFGKLGAKSILDIKPRDSLIDFISNEQEDRIIQYLNAEEIKNFTKNLNKKYNVKIACNHTKAECVKSYSDVLTERIPLEDRIILDSKEDIGCKTSAPIVALNADSLTPSDVLTRKVDFDYWAERPESDLNKAIRDGCFKLKNEPDAAAFIALFPTATPKDFGRTYQINKNLVVTRISKKNKKNSMLEAGVFVFNPKAMADIAMPLDKSKLGLNWLCQQLIAQGETVYARMYACRLYDMNYPRDCMLFRKHIRTIDATTELVSRYGPFGRRHKEKIFEAAGVPLND